MNYMAQDAFTAESIPVKLGVNLRYRLVEPLKLTQHYDTVAQALTNPLQQAINKVVARMSYQQFMRSAKIDSEAARDPEAKPVLETFKADCLHLLSEQAESYGIKVEDINILSRALTGDMGKQLEAQADMVIKNQGAISQIQQNIDIAAGEKAKELRQAELNQQINTKNADTNYYTQQKAADGQAYATIKAASANAEKLKQDALGRAEAQRIETEQQVKTIQALAKAEADRITAIAQARDAVAHDGLAGEMIRLEMRVKQNEALPRSTTVFANTNESGSIGGVVTGGYAAAVGASMALRAAENQ